MHFPELADTLFPQNKSPNNTSAKCQQRNSPPFIFEHLTHVLHSKDLAMGQYETAQAVVQRGKLQQRQLHLPSCFSSVIQISYLFSLHAINEQQHCMEAQVVFDKGTVRSCNAAMIMKLSCGIEQKGKQEITAVDTLFKLLRQIVKIGEKFKNKSHIVLENLKETLNIRSEGLTMEKLMDRLESSILFQKHSTLLLYQRCSPLMNALDTPNQKQARQQNPDLTKVEQLYQQIQQLVESRLGFEKSQLSQPSKYFMHIRRDINLPTRSIKYSAYFDYQESAPLLFNVSAEENTITVRHITRFQSCMETSDYLVSLANQFLSQYSGNPFHVLFELQQLNYKKHLSFVIRIMVLSCRSISDLMVEVVRALDVLLIYGMVFSNSKLETMEISKCDQVQEIQHYMGINRHLSMMLLDPNQEEKIPQ